MPHTSLPTPPAGNPAKFLLGFASIFFDLIFMAQHFCLYPAHDVDADAWAAADLEEACARGQSKLQAAEAAAVSGSGGGGGSALPAPLPVAVSSPPDGELEVAAPEEPLLRGG